MCKQQPHLSLTAQHACLQGWNTAALWACAIGLVPSLPGFLAEVRLVGAVSKVWQTAYSLSWFIGTALAMGVYCLLMRDTQTVL